MKVISHVKGQIKINRDQVKLNDLQTRINRKMVQTVKMLTERLIYLEAKARGGKIEKVTSK
jgi:hypothetical protein